MGAIKSDKLSTGFGALIAVLPYVGMLLPQDYQALVQPVTSILTVIFGLWAKDRKKPA